MAGEPKSKDQGTKEKGQKCPSNSGKYVRLGDAVIPALRKMFGDGAAVQPLIDGLTLVETNTLTAIGEMATKTGDRLDEMSVEVTAATETATGALSKASAVEDAVGTAGSTANEAITLAQGAATKADHTALKERVVTIETHVNTANAGIAALNTAMTQEVTVKDKDGGLSSKKMQGPDLVAYLVKTVGTQVAVLGAFSGKLDNLSKETGAASADAAEAKTLAESAQKKPDDSTMQAVKILETALAGLTDAVKEAFENLDGKLQVIAQLALGESYEGDVQEALEAPSFKMEGAVDEDKKR